MRQHSLLAIFKFNFNFILKPLFAIGSEDEGSSASKKVKTVQWEWLGDGGKWTQYSEEHNEKLIDSFCVGADEVTIPVAKGVKMKIKFRTMSQANVATGWPRDIRCVPTGATDYKPSVWEWNEGGVWKRCGLCTVHMFINPSVHSIIHPSILSFIHPFSCLSIHLSSHLSIHLCRYPESTRRQLEAAYLSDVDGLGVTVATKSYNIDLKGEEMEDELNSSLKWKIRRVDPDDTNYNGIKRMNGL